MLINGHGFSVLQYFDLLDQQCIADGFHPTQTHSGQAAEVRPGSCSHLVVNNIPRIEKKTVVGNTTTDLQKFNDGWKIVAVHSSTG
jgi:hypothetical protein